MSKLIPLSPSEHKKAFIDPIRAINDFRTAQVVRLRVPEVGNAACCFPVVFTKDPQMGSWDISALTSLEPESNLFIGDGQWLGVYSPLAIRTHPVCLAKFEDQEQVSLALRSEDLSTSGVELYDDHGRPTEHLRTVEQALHEDLSGASATQVFCRQLQSLELIQPINIKVLYQDDTSRTLEGLYTLDQDRLSALVDSALLELQKRGYLMAMHSMLTSLFQLNRLIKRHNESGATGPIQKVILQRR